MPEKKTKKIKIMESRGMSAFREKTETALSKIDDSEFREEEMVAYIFEVGEWLFKNKLDITPEEQLVRVGGKLTGISAYLGNKSAMARAERDVYRQKKEEVINEISVKKYNISGKITLAKAEAKLEAAELDDVVIGKELEKNNYENILKACDKMVSFIQSAIKVKESEKFKSRTHQNNG